LQPVNFFETPTQAFSVIYHIIPDSDQAEYVAFNLSSASEISLSLQTLKKPDDFNIPNSDISNNIKNIGYYASGGTGGGIVGYGLSSPYTPFYNPSYSLYATPDNTPILKVNVSPEDIWAYNSGDTFNYGTFSIVKDGSTKYLQIVDGQLNLTEEPI
jgi:hypothetical protein